jgi:putative hemolysin
MKALRSKKSVAMRAERDQKLDAALQRFQANLGLLLSFALFTLLIFGGRMGNGGNGQVSMEVLGMDPIAAGPAFAALVALILLNALFTAAETAIELVRPMHVKFLREDNPLGADRIQHILDREPRYAASSKLAGQITKILMVVVCFVLAPNALELCSAWFGWSENYLTLIGAMLLVMAPVGLFNLVFGELIPQSFAAVHPPRVGLVLYRFIRATAFLFSPLSALVTGIAGLFTARFGGRASFTIVNQAEEEIKTIVESAEETGEIEQEEKELLHSVFEFTDTVAREVMTPRVDLDALPIKSDPTEVMRLIHETGHSRIPLYEETDDQIVGIIHAKDLMMMMINGRAPNLRSLMRPALFVPENKNLHELLEEMRRHRTQMAIVQDEFGGTAGIVTIEDIVEELVGEIVDEYDVEEPEVQPIEGGWLVDGKTHVDDVNHELDSSFPNDDFDTIGGYVFGLFGRQPAQDEFIETDGYRFTVAESDGRRIAKLKIEPVAPQLQDESAELV